MDDNKLIKCKWHLCNKALSGRQTKYCSKKCNSKEAISKKRKKIKEKAVTYKGGSCKICGYDKYVEALTFHHTNDNKEFGIAAGGFCIAWERLKAELDKCELLCIRCHMELHAKEHQQVRQKNITAITHTPIQKIKTCKYCKKEFLAPENSYAQYCTEQCRTTVKKILIEKKKSQGQISKRTSIPATDHRPEITKEVLTELVNTYPMIKIGEKFGVTDNSVRKWCKSLDIPMKPAGYWAKFKYKKDTEDQTSKGNISE